MQGRLPRNRVHLAKGAPQADAPDASSLKPPSAQLPSRSSPLVPDRKSA